MKEATNHLKAFVTRIVTRPIVAKALHTAWQASLGVLVAGIFAAHSSGDVKALVIAAVAAGASAAKSSVLAYVSNYRNGL